MSRGGAVPEEWPALIRAALQRAGGRPDRDQGHLVAPGLVGRAEERGERAPSWRPSSRPIEVAESFGVDAEFKHLANSGATLALPETHFNLVRPGVATYGLSPFGHALPSGELGLRPAMTLKARLAMVKRVPAGVGVSYGLTWTAPRPSTLGLIPLGYGDGLPRHASNGAPVQSAGQRRSDRRPDLHGPVRGQPRGRRRRPRATRSYCSARGPTASRRPTTGPTPPGTINYEIVTRLGAADPAPVRRQFAGRGVGDVEGRTDRRPDRSRGRSAGRRRGRRRRGRAHR